MAATQEATAEANLDGFQKDPQMPYAALDQTIGKANRMIEEMGFH